MRGINSAKQVVEFCQAKPMFRQVNQKKYLLAVTTRRSYHNLTGNEVEELTGKQVLRDRTVKSFAGLNDLTCLESQ